MKVLTWIVFFAIAFSDCIDVPQYKHVPNELLSAEKFSEKEMTLNNRQDQEIQRVSRIENKAKISADAKTRHKRSLNESGYYGESEAHQSYNDSSTYKNSTEMSLEEKMAKLRVEMVKLQILSQLGLKRPPQTSGRQSRSANEMIETLMDMRDEELESGGRLAIQAKNDGIECSREDENHCRIFNFEVSSAPNSTSASLWVYRTDRSSVRNILVSVSCCNSEEERYNADFFENVPNYGWNEAELPESLQPISRTNNFSCSIEVRGVEINYQGDRRPFLFVSESSTAPARRRRDTGCDSNERCCLKPLTKTFAEIGFDFVVYPYRVELNMCTGKCRSDPSTNSHYQTALMASLEKDPELEESFGMCASLCCKPKQLAPVMIFYNDSQGLVDQANITELTVVSCGCT